MATDRSGGEPAGRRYDDPVQVFTCSRIGMRATPPGPRLSLTGWMRRR